MKKLIRRIIATVSCIAVMIAAIVTPGASITASANVFNGQGITLIQGSPVYYISLGIPGGHYTYRYYVTDSEGNQRVVYCVEPAKTGPTGGTYNANIFSDAYQGNAPLMKKLLYYGVGGPGYGGEGSIANYYPGYSEDQLYALTHIALGYAYFAVTGDWDGAMYGTGISPSDFNENNIALGGLVRWMNNGKSCPETPASVSKSSLVCDKEYTSAGGSVWIASTEKVTISGTVTLPQGIALISDINNPSSPVWSNTTATFGNQSFHVAKIKTSVTNGATDTIYVTGQGMGILSINTGAASQMMAYYVTESNSASLSMTYDTTLDVTSIQLTKTGLTPTSISGTEGNYTFGWTNQGVSGATYGIYSYGTFTDEKGITYAANQLLSSATTGTGGKVSIESIPVSGNTTNDQETYYYIKEITPAPGYKLDTQGYGVKWDATNGWAGTTIVSGVCNVSDDRLPYSITYPTKTNSAGNPLPGATMGIYNKEAITINGTTIPAGTLIRSAITDSDGKASINIEDLPYGKSWIYKEVTPPLGYKLNETDSFEFTTNETTQAATTPIVDESKLGIITIEKHGDALVGISGTEGNYTFNYASSMLNDFTFEIWTTDEITDAGTGWTFPANTKIATAKTGSATGTVYTTANSAGINVEISCTADGTVTITNLIFGTYKIVEVEGQQGYVVDGNQNASVSETDPVKIASFTNQTIPTPVEAQIKIDEAGNPIKNAVFGLYTADTITAGGVTLQPDTLLRTVTTGDDGKIDFVFTDLPFGHSFYTKEITQPTGYVANNSKVTINIDGTTQKPANVVNVEQYGIIKVSKSGEVLTGVTGTEGNLSFTYASANLDGFTYNIFANEEITSAKGWHFTENQKVATVTTGDTSKCEQIDKSNPALVLTFSTDSQGNIVVSGLPLGSYRIEEASGMPGYVIEGSNVVTVAGDDTGLVSVTNTTSFVNQKQICQLEMTKKDSTTNVVLEGAEFTLYAQEDITLPDGTVVVENGKAIETITTDATGKASFTTVLPYGFKFIVRETKAPVGYTLSDYTFNFEFKTTDTSSSTIDLTNGNATITNDYVVGEIEIRKNDSDLLTNVSRGGASLNGAIYEVYADGDIMLPDKSGIAYHDGDLIVELSTGKPADCVSHVANTLTFTSTDDGQIKVTGIYLGKYLVKEKTASEGYLIDINNYNVTLTYADDKTPVISDTIISKEQVAKERFYINKKGTDGSESERIIPVKGAEFKLYATIGLTYNNSKYTITSSSYAVHKMWKTGNEDDYILVASAAEETAAALLGFDNSEEYVLASDEKGYLESGFLPYGMYVLHETKTPSGRSTCSDIVIELSKDNPTGFWNDDKEEKDFTLFNNTIIIKKNPIKISKYDVTGTKELPGATLRLTDANGNLIDEWVSTEEPHVVSGLIVGQTYTLTEIIAPKNYKLATSIQFVTIKDPNNTMHVIMRDEFNLKIRTGEVGLNMWVYLGIMLTLIGVCIGGVAYIKRKKIDIRKFFTNK